MPEKNRKIKKLAAIGGLLVLILVLVLVAIPFLIPADVVVGRVQDLVEQKTGRRLSIDGGVAFSVFSGTSVRISGVRLSNPSHMSDVDMASIKALDVHIALLPLLQKRIEISSLVLQDPVIHLQDHKKGGNWVFKTETKSPPSSENDKNFSAGGVYLGDVRVKNGTVSYVDVSGKKIFSAEKINIGLDAPGMDKPLNIEGRANIDGVPFLFDFTGGPLSSLLQSETLEASLKITSDLFDLDFSGTVFPDKTRLLSGRSEVKSGSLRVLGDNFPDVALGLEGQVSARKNGFSFSKAKVSVGEFEGAGSFNFEWGNRLKASGSIKTDKIDIDYFNQLLPQTTKKTASQGWDKSSLNFSPLREFDADMTVTTQSISYQKLKTGPAMIDIQLRRGDLKIEMPQTDLSGGQIAVLGRLNAAQDIPGAALVLKAKSIDIHPVLSSLADVSFLHGAADVETSVRMSGKSIHDMVSDMNGNGALIVQNGRMDGFSIAYLVEHYKKTFLLGEGNAGKTTEFDHLGGTFTIKNGIVESQNLRLKSPDLTVDATAKIGLPDKNLYAELQPRVLLSDSAVSVPLILKGTFDKIKVLPDLKRLATDTLANPDIYKKGAGAVEDTVKAIGGKMQEDIDHGAETVKEFMNLFGGGEE